MPQTPHLGVFMSVACPPTKQQISSLTSLYSWHRSSNYYLEWRCDIWILYAALASKEEDLESFLDRWLQRSMPLAPEEKRVLFTLRSHRSEEEISCFAKSLFMSVSAENPVFGEVCSLLRKGTFRFKVFQKAIEKGWCFFDFEIDQDLSFYEKIYLQTQGALFPLFSLHRSLDVDGAFFSDLSVVRCFFSQWEEMGFVGFCKLCFLSFSKETLRKSERLIESLSQLRLPQEGVKKSALIIASQGFSQMRSEWSALMGGARLEFLDPSCFKRDLVEKKGLFGPVGEKIEEVQCSPLGQVSLSLNRLWMREGDASVEFGLVAEQTQRSPGNYLHNLFMKQFFPKARYRSLALESADAALFFDRFFSCKTIGTSFLGLSVSSPYKTLVRNMVADRKEVTKSALVELTGACNTLLRTDRGFYADNTDVRAFEVCLRLLNVDKEAPILILGAGSCALAFTRASLSWGFQSVAICSRKKPSWREVACGQVQHFPWSYEKSGCNLQKGLIEQYLTSGKSQGFLVQASGVENASFGERGLHGLYPVDLERYFAKKGKWLELNNVDFPRLAVSRFTRDAKKRTEGICAQEFFALQAALQADLWFSSSASSLLQGCFFSYYKRCLERGYLSALIDAGLGEMALFSYLFFRTQLERGACGRYFHPIMEA